MAESRDDMTAFFPNATTFGTRIETGNPFEAGIIMGGTAISIAGSILIYFIARKIRNYYISLRVSYNIINLKFS